MKEIKQLLDITKELRRNYGRSFSLDGRLVGDIGEVLAAEKYGLKLLPENSPTHDAIEIATGRKVQIKSSFKNYCYFPYRDIPDYFLAINILESGEIEELYNGTGKFLFDNYIVKRQLTAYNNTFYTMTKGVLIRLNSSVPISDKIKPIKTSSLKN